MSRSAPHPTAKAFFDALDARQSSLNQSAVLQRRSQSLGWRNRYSQNEQYPVSMTVFDRVVAFSVRQVQRGEIEGTYGTGATVWPAAMIMLKYLEKNPLLIRGKRVVDLGSGTGLTSLAAALLGANHVVCTDGEDPVVRLASENCGQVVLTKLEPSTEEQTTDATSDLIKVESCPIVVQKYWWGTQPLPDESCDVILVADCVLPKLYPIAPLVQAIDELMPKRRGSNSDERVAILSYEHRYFPEYDPRAKFQELAQARGLVVETIPNNQLDHVYNVDDIEIWHVTRKRI